MGIRIEAALVRRGRRRKVKTKRCLFKIFIGCYQM